LNTASGVLLGFQK